MIVFRHILVLQVLFSVWLCFGEVQKIDSFPDFSWDTLPVFYHAANETGPMPESEVDFITRFPLVTFEKYTAQNYPPANEGAEKKIVAAAKQIKMKKSSVKVLFYLNSVMDWDMYDLHTYLQQHESLLLHDKNGNLVKIRNQGVFDLSQAEMRTLWVNVIKNATASGYIDGVFADRGNNQSFSNVAEEKEAAWLDGHAKLLQEAQAALGEDSVLISNNQDWTGITGRMFENFGAKDFDTTRSWLSDIELLQNEGSVPRVAEVHGEPCSSDNYNKTLAAFLVGAGKYSYYACSSGWTDKTAWNVWRPEYSKPLGEPLGDAKKVTDGDIVTFSRSFKSGTHVTFQLNTKTEEAVPCIHWSDGTFTGSKSCAQIEDM